MDVFPHDEMTGHRPEEEDIRTDVLELMYRVRYIDLTRQDFVVSFHEDQSDSNGGCGGGPIKYMNHCYLLCSDC